MMKKPKKVAVWSILVSRGMVSNRQDTERWVLAGQVFIGSERVHSASQLVEPDSEIHVRGLSQKYVGRGGLKLEGALRDFKMKVPSRIALDTGASTGGFTDCLLQHGVARVYAIDVGHGQLTGRLRQDARVVNMERTNISDVTREQLDPTPTMATVDLSYLSLRDAIPIIRNLLEFPRDMLCLVKPLFEVRDAVARRSGEIRDTSVYRDILDDMVSYAHSLGLVVRGIANSPITGNNGTHEFFIWLSETGRQPESLVAEIDKAVQRILQT